MKLTAKFSIISLVGLYLCGCATVDPNSEASAVKRLVAAEGPLQTNVDPDFEGEAYDQNGDKIECRKTKVTGSRIGQYTVCRTAAEWAITEDFASTNMKEMQEQGGAVAGD